MGYSLRSYSPTSLPALTVAGPIKSNGNLTMGSGAKLKIDNSNSTTDCPLQINGDPNTGLTAIAADIIGNVAGGTTRSYSDASTGFVINGIGVHSGNATFSAKVLKTPPAAQAINAVGTTIAPTAGIHEFTSNGNYTLTVAPTIADGVDGQLLLLVNVGANTITIQDQGTLASSNLRLTATTVAIGPRDSIYLYYSGDVGDWVQVGSLVAVI